MRLKGAMTAVDRYIAPAMRAAFLVGCMTLSPYCAIDEGAVETLGGGGDSADQAGIASGAVDMDSLALALARGWTTVPTSAHPLPESFALLRRHLRAAIGRISSLCFYE
jgi:hypothetical protein